MAITTANNSSSSRHPRRPHRNRRHRTTSTGSSDSGRSYLALKSVALIGIICCTVRNLLSPTSMNLKQWTMLASPIVTITTTTHDISMTTTPVTTNKRPSYISSAPLSLINETSTKKIQLTIEALDHTNPTTTTTTTTTILDRRNETLFPSPINHPFAGARDVDGNWGYVADPTLVRTLILERYRLERQQQQVVTELSYQDMIDNHYLPFNNNTVNELQKVCETPPGKGPEMNGFDILAKKVVIDGPSPVPRSNTTTAATATALAPPAQHYYNTPTPPRVFCGLYTYRKRHYLAREAAETWGWRCDGFLAFSDVTDPSFGAVDLPHYGDEHYDNMWQKVRSIWMYIYTNYGNDYDYFHVSGDDAMLMPINLQNYLWTIDDENGTKPLYVGGVARLGGMWMCGGGSGYTLNRVVLEWLASGPFRTAPAKRVSNEDRQMGYTLRELTRCYATHDVNGGKRYIGADPNYMALLDGKSSRSKFMNEQHQMYQKLIGMNVSKAETVSSQALSWHWLRAPLTIKRLQAIMYRSCPKGTSIANALDAIDDHQ